jgi:uncharacterized cupin superfamily protein
MKIVNTTTEPWEPGISRGNYLQRRKALGGTNIACGLWELAPGKKSFPMHKHHITEEALFVISGTGVVRTPTELHPISAGDFVSFPAGGEAHQLLNEGSVPLIYIAMSAPKGVDVVEYPDSKKIMASVGVYPNSQRHIFKDGTQVDYNFDDPDAGPISD